MYTPPAFREDDHAALRRIMRDARLSTLVTATAEGLVATPLPLFLDETEGELGTLYGHLKRVASDEIQDSCFGFWVIHCGLKENRDGQAATDGVA